MFFYVFQITERDARSPRGRWTLIILNDGSSCNAKRKVYRYDQINCPPFFTPILTKLPGRI